jgi:hypothetical protein
MVNASKKIPGIFIQAAVTLIWLFHDIFANFEYKLQYRNISLAKMSVV